MRKRVLGNVPHVRLSLAMLMALLASLTVAGCGGGGGGTPSGGTTGGTTGGGTTVPVGSKTLATVTGIVTDTTAAATPISGAVISIAGTSLKATTGADGKFAIVNVPVGTVGISVLTPDASRYQGIVLYGATGAQKEYDSQACPISLVTQISAKGVSAVPYNLELFPNSTSSPPAPPLYGANGCPK